MRLSKIVLALAVTCTATLLAAAAAQETKQPAKTPTGPSSAQQPTQPPAAPMDAAMDAMMPKPLPEHAHLQKLVGTWDATVSMMMPGAPPATSKGSMVYKPVGEMWVVGDFTGDMMGMVFTGHGVDGYDPQKKKYVSSWVDSMTSEMMLMEGTYDEATKSMTMTGQGRDMTGKLVPHRMVTEMKDADTMVLHMHMPGLDGKETETMKIEYKRRK